MKSLLSFFLKKKKNLDHPFKILPCLVQINHGMYLQIIISSNQIFIYINEPSLMAPTGEAHPKKKRISEMNKYFIRSQI